jgi:hypothetical protein
LRREEAGLQQALIALSRQQAVRSAAVANMALAATAQTETEELESQVEQTLAQHPNLLPIDDSTELLKQMNRVEADDETASSSDSRPFAVQGRAEVVEPTQAATLPPQPLPPQPIPAACLVYVDDAHDSLFAYLSDSDSEYEDEDDSENDNDNTNQGEAARIVVVTTTSGEGEGVAAEQEQEDEEDHDIIPVWGKGEDDATAEEEEKEDAPSSDMDGCDSD